MVDATSNDNDACSPVTTKPEVDAHGQAALLLVESLIHGLVARSLLSVPDAIEVVTIAADVKVEVAAETGESCATMQRSLMLLEAIARSLSNDLPR